MKKIASRYPLPGWLALSQLEAFLAETTGRYAVQWIEQSINEPTIIQPAH